MFKNLFNKGVKSVENTKEVTVPCTCKENNEHCDLVLQLRKCQDLRKKIKNEIEMSDKDSYALLDNFFCFLKILEKNGVFMNSYRAYLLGETTFDERTINIIKDEISKCSSGDIFRITEELKTYKNKENIIREKQRALKAVENDIKGIKVQLGIE